MPYPSQPIGIFDSGVGGLTVMKQLMATLPQERLIYFGDTARLPYGNKSRDTIVRYSIENARFLLKQSIKLLVVACHTASALALSALQQLCDIPIIGVIEPGAAQAVALTRNQRIAVLGTKSTIASEVYPQTIKQLAPDAQVISVACPLFVPLVEEQWLDHPASRLIVQEYLHPLRHQKVDTLLLGCTHYPILKPLIQQAVGAQVLLVDSATGCAERAATLLSAQKLLSPTLEGHHRYYASDDLERFSTLAGRIFGHPITDWLSLTPT